MGGKSIAKADAVPETPPESERGDDRSKSRSCSECRRGGPSRRERRRLDEKGRPENRRGRGGDPQEARHGAADAANDDDDDEESRAVMLCDVCGRMVGGGRVGMASHVQNSKVHATWLYYKTMPWKEAQARANKEWQRAGSWSAGPAKSNKATEVPEHRRARRPERSRTPVRGRGSRRSRSAHRPKDSARARKDVPRASAPKSAPKSRRAEDARRLKAEACKEDARTEDDDDESYSSDDDSGEFERIVEESPPKQTTKAAPGAKPEAPKAAKASSSRPSRAELVADFLDSQVKLLRDF